MAIIEESCVAAAELRLTENPVADSGRKVDIGPVTYWFGPSIPAGAVSVAVGVDAAGTRFNLVNAINGGSQNLKASTYEDVVRIVNADAPNGNPVEGAGQNLALSYNTPAMSQDKWNVSNLMHTVCGKFSSGEKVVDTMTLQKNNLRVTFAFTPVRATVEHVRFKMVRAVDSVAIEGQDIVIPLGMCQSGSKLRWYVYGD